MKFLKYILFIFFITNLSISNAENIDLSTKITKNLRCLICQGQSVYDSDSEFANSVKILVKGKLSEGKAEEDIYALLKDKYGEWILYDPKFSNNTYFLWLLPILMFVVGGAIIVRLFIIRKN